MYRESSSLIRSACISSSLCCVALSVASVVAKRSSRSAAVVPLSPWVARCLSNTAWRLSCCRNMASRPETIPTNCATHGACSCADCICSRNCSNSKPGRETTGKGATSGATEARRGEARRDFQSRRTASSGCGRLPGIGHGGHWPDPIRLIGSHLARLGLWVRHGRAQFIELSAYNTACH
ncbi:uncharacterized protein C8Q71DRAFT_288266 [Rhodofomes roseus]|uniref:Secreted protein n=1 Tax=Rhodofomes roseus TaxID=34475 RepID=A0ABQ8K4P6_9APHY|nr:uncharacterized protein C8Q71DRAFT_288266 [Rhodofomes roseus]KAH9831867.1 hypothetical protein C8Q71DRAFT_288266 [Rhodofomes roseus]